MRGFEVRAGREGLDEGKKIAVVDHAIQLQVQRDATRTGVWSGGGGGEREVEAAAEGVLAYTRWTRCGMAHDL